MKGGITSGVVYPLAAVRLSEEYRFKNVGGTSAGAIAAAAVAAAEHGRSTGAGTSFEEVRDLPAWLGSNLTSVFQPTRGTKPLFSMLLAGTSGGPGAAVASALAGFPLWALAGALPGALLMGAAIASASGLLLFWALVCGFVLALAGAAAMLAAGVLRRAMRTLPENGFGLVTGFAGEGPAGAQPLTEWLADLLDRLAGKTGSDALTFGDLWGSEDPAAPRELNLEMMTTSLTQGRPYRLPLTGRAARELWFDPEEMRRLFPARVVDQMVRDGKAVEGAERFAPLVPLPPAAKLPVVVATRMSLSFPLLISALPLHGIDWSRPQPDGTHRPARCWFSDGGICSNFPVHFFDSPVPRWPTFAIDLRKLPGDWAPSEDERENVWMPPDNDVAADEWWAAWDELPPRRRLMGFAGSILRTMQNWVDQTQARVHGYRDRIVRIEHSHTEGGLNLTMSEGDIRRLSTRGGCAGELLGDRFAVPPRTDSPLTWENQRWVRYRSFMRLLEDSLGRLRLGYLEPDAGGRPVPEMSERAEGDPPEFHWVSAEQRRFALEATEAAIAVAAEWEADAEGFAPGSPEPAPELRIAPRI
jgi:hypothetical protein